MKEILVIFAQHNSPFSQPKNKSKANKVYCLISPCKARGGGEAAEKAVNTNFVKAEGFDSRVKCGSFCRQNVYRKIKN